jgi:hypothetical protein
MNIEELTIHYDFYGKLLSDRQQEVVHMICEEDFSLTETGENLGISKQAVSEVLRRSTKKLHSYEAKLGMIGRFQSVVSQLEKIEGDLATVEAQGDAKLKQELAAMRQAIKNMIKQF